MAPYWPVIAISEENNKPVLDALNFKMLYLYFHQNIIYTTFFSLVDTERHLEQLHRGVLQDPDLDNPYIVLSQHQMQNLGKS